MNIFLLSLKAFNGDIFALKMNKKIKKKKNGTKDR